MDREILFRGFHREPNGKDISIINGTPEHGTWLYGNLLRTDDGWYIIQNYIPSHMLSRYEVDPSTVGQYTGLTDRNGKKIFNGDIIRWVDWKKNVREAAVRYDPEWNRFCLWLNGAESMGVNQHLSEDIEVIGSVHDNPELIGGEDDG